MEFLSNIFGGLTPIQETLIPIIIILALVASMVPLLNIFFKRDDYENFYPDARADERKKSRAEKRAEAKAKRAEVKAQKLAKGKKAKGKDRDGRDASNAVAPVLATDMDSASDSSTGDSAPAALLQRANMHMAAGDLDKAEQVFLAINKHRPSDMDAVKSLLSIYGERKDVEKFSNTYESAMRLLQTSSDTLGEQQALENIKTRFFSPDADSDSVPSAAESLATNLDIDIDEPSWLSDAQYDVPDFGDSAPSGAPTQTESAPAEPKPSAHPKPAVRTMPLAKTADDIQTEGKPQYEQTLIKRFQNKDFNATVLLLTMYGNRQDQLSFDEVFPIATDHAKEGNNQSAELAQLEQLRERYFAGMEAATPEMSVASVSASEDLPTAAMFSNASADDTFDLNIDEMPDFSDIDDVLATADSASDDDTSLLDDNELGVPEFIALDDMPSDMDYPIAMDALKLSDDLQMPDSADSAKFDAAEEEKLLADFDMLMDNETILIDVFDDGVAGDNVSSPAMASDGLADDMPASSTSRMAELEANAGESDIRHREFHHDDPEEELYYLNETRIEFAETMLRADNQLAAMQLFEKVLESGDKKHSDGVKERIIQMLSE